MRTPFTASSLDNTFFAFVGELGGSFSVGPDSITVLVNRATIRLREATTIQGPRILDSLSVRLAYASGPSWALEETSAAMGVGRRMQPRDEIHLQSLRFVIARPMRAPLSQFWLVFELKGRTIGPDGQPVNPGSAFVHTDRTILSAY